MPPCWSGCLPWRTRWIPIPGAANFGACGCGLTGSSCKPWHKALDLDPNYPHPHRNLARVYYAKEKWHEAMFHIDKQISMGADDWWVWHARGEIRAAGLRQWQQAAPDFAKAVARDDASE